MLLPAGKFVAAVLVLVSTWIWNRFIVKALVSNSFRYLKYRFSGHRITRFMLECEEYILNGLRLLFWCGAIAIIIGIWHQQS